MYNQLIPPVCDWPYIYFGFGFGLWHLIENGSWPSLLDIVSSAQPSFQGLSFSPPLFFLFPPLLPSPYPISQLSRVLQGLFLKIAKQNCRVHVLFILTIELYVKVKID